jgi:hypothetical protein
MERWISIGSLVLGCVAFGVVFSARGTPDGPSASTVAGALPTVKVSEEPAPSRDSALESREASLIELPPVEITGAPSTSAERAAATPARTLSLSPPPTELATEPCSPWRELGPKHVDEGVGTGSHRVRELC